MVEQLWATVLARNRIMEIAEKIAPHFKTQYTDAEGSSARYISVKTIDFTEKYYEESVDYQVSIEYLTDIGAFTADVVIKEFTSQYNYEQELNLHNLLEQRLFLYNTIRPATILYDDPTSLLVVYNQSRGKHIGHIDIDQDLADYQYGVLAAVLHGGNVVDHSFQETKELLAYLLSKIPFSQEERERFNQLLKSHFDLLEQSKGGYEPVNAFGSHVFCFTPLQKPVNRLLLQRLRAFEIDIKMEQPSEQFADRMADAANYFSQEAFDEYLQHQNVRVTQKRLKDYLDGYRDAYQQIMFQPLEKIYPLGLPLDIHFVEGLWILYYFQINDQNPRTDYTIGEIIAFSDFLLQQRPFQTSYQLGHPTKSMVVDKTEKHRRL